MKAEDYEILSGSKKTDTWHVRQEMGRDRYI